MINLKKILFFDVETCGITATYEKLLVEKPRLAALWKVWQDKYKDTNKDTETGLPLSLNDVWVNKAGLHPEYGKIVCASFGYFDKDMQMKITSFYGHDEKDILEKCAKILNNSDNSGFSLSGYNIDKFDVSFLYKRMIVHGIVPPKIINCWDKKPWELKFIDLAKVWSGSYNSFTSLDTLSAVLDIESPKDELKGSMVHNSYWNEDGIENIKRYCENDIKCTMAVGEKIINLINQ